MPNWCFSRITIRHKDVQKLESLIKLWTSKNYQPNGFGTNWLGNIVLGSGIGTVNSNKSTDIACRGSLEDMEYIADDMIKICTATAWGPLMKMWKLIRDKYLMDAELIFEADESSCGIYITNDPQLRGRYIIDSWDIESIQSDWEASEANTIVILQRLLNTKESNIDNLLEAFEDSEHSDKMSVHAWDFCSIHELE